MGERHASERNIQGGAVGRTFWIQGRSGVYWQNLEDLEDGQAAIARLGVLVGDGRYDELRLIQADISPMTGATDYLHIVTVRDGQVLAPNSDEFAARSPYDEEEPPPEEMPQLLLWPDAEADESDRQHPLPLNEVLEDDPPAAKGPPVPGARPAERRLDDGSWDVGGWRISDAAHAAIDAAEQQADRAAARSGETGDAPDAPRKAPGGLAVGRDDAHIFARRAETRPAARGPARRLMDRVGRRDKARPDKRAKGRAQPRPDRRMALMSGVFAGAIAVGLAISAAAPDKAADLYAAALRDLSVLAPDLSLDEAVATGDIAALHGKLAAGANPNARDVEGTPLLLRAARGGNLQAVSLLLQAGADPTLPGPDGRSVLHRAATEGLSLALARMLDAGAPVDLIGGSDGCITPLAAAAGAGKARAASILAERGASLGAQPDCPAGPMEIAAAHPLLLARLEAIRAEREGWIRLATGPRPPREEPAPSASAPPPPGEAVRGEPERDAVPAAEAPPPKPTPAPIGADDLVEVLETGPTVVAVAPPETAPTETAPPPPTTAATAATRTPDTTPEAESPEAESPGAGSTTSTTGATEPAEPAQETVASVPETTATPDTKPAGTENPDTPLETVEVAGLPVNAAPPPGAQAPDRTPPAPRVKPEPPPVPEAQTPEARANSAREAVPTKPQDADGKAAAIATAIDRGAVGEVERLTESLSTAELAPLTVVADDRYGAGERGLVDHAVLRGRRRIADMLIERGLAPSPTALHAAIANADRPELAGTVEWLLERAVDPNARVEGLTPLMRAALRGRGDLTEALLAAGAEPAAATEDGRTAADFARRAGRPALQETLLLAAQEQRYRALMLGMSWTDTMDTLAERIERCKDIGDDFTACKLKTDAWLDDASVVVGQFDRRADGRLVALQIDSRPIGDPSAARRRFEEVANAIEDRLPSDHGGFTNRRAPEGGAFFHALRPEINQGAYFGYWPDHDRARPVFVHLKLAGIDDQRGFYRIVIGNPFRAS